MILIRPDTAGFWAVDVLRDGNYEITLFTRPSLPPPLEKGGWHPLNAVKARIKIGDIEESREPPALDATAVTFRVNLKKGPARLQTWLDAKDGTSRGAYFVEVKYVE